MNGPFFLNEHGKWCPRCQEAVEADETACPCCGYPDTTDDETEREPLP